VSAHRPHMPAPPHGIGDKTDPRADEDSARLRRDGAPRESTDSTSPSAHQLRRRSQPDIGRRRWASERARSPSDDRKRSPEEVAQALRPPAGDAAGRGEQPGPRAPGTPVRGETDRPRRRAKPSLHEHGGECPSTVSAPNPRGEGPSRRPRFAPKRLPATGEVGRVGDFAKAAYSPTASGPAARYDQDEDPPSKLGSWLPAWEAAQARSEAHDHAAPEGPRETTRRGCGGNDRVGGSRLSHPSQINQPEDDREGFAPEVGRRAFQLEAPQNQRQRKRAHERHLVRVSPPSCRCWRRC